jgi:glycolate dehydrogenase FAD-binding subunit
MSTVRAATEVESSLREAIPGASITFDTQPFEVDGLRPSLVLAPASPEEVASALRVANQAGAAVIPWGGGSQMTLGNLPSRYDLALDLTGIDKLVEYQPADLTLTAQAGARLAAIQQVLAEKGQWLPLDAASSSGATLGGILASNASGPARIRFGTARDLVIGMTVATAEGDIVKSGGRVVKNVAGYDLAKLHIGALATLGIIVQASFKVSPLPPVSTSLVTGALDPEIAVHLASDIEKAVLAVTGVAVLGMGGHLATAVRLAGSRGAVERSRAECIALAAKLPAAFQETAATFWESRGAVTPNTPSTFVSVRVAAPAGRVAAIASSILALGGRVVGYPAAGTVRGTWPEGSEAVAAWVIDLRGQLGPFGAVVVEAAPTAFKGKIDVWGPPRADFGLMRRLKDEMDPNHILNPGRFIGGI